MSALLTPPRVLAYGMGVDSTALLIELHARGEAPDLVLTADTGSDKPASYAYLEMMKLWMAERGIEFQMVRYEPQRFKHWPPYYGIHEMCLTNGTVPSISMGRHSCSLKYKKAPQDKFLSQWEPARAAWSLGQKVVRLIGFDASPRDTVRYTHASTIEDPLYQTRYPLREWGWTRDVCAARIEAAGLPVPPKSSCFLCIGMTPQELCELPDWCLRVIVLVEARAAPRMRTVEGLWRTTSKSRPGRMTTFIRSAQLLPSAEIDAIIADAPDQLVAFQEGAAEAELAARPHLADWLTRFNMRGSASPMAGGMP